jgi:hypothetical protein
MVIIDLAPARRSQKSISLNRGQRIAGEISGKFWKTEGRTEVTKSLNPEYQPHYLPQVHYRGKDPHFGWEVAPRHIHAISARWHDPHVGHEYKLTCA